MAIKYNKIEYVPETVAVFGDRLEKLGFENFQAQVEISYLKQNSVYVYCSIPGSVHDELKTTEHSEFIIDTVSISDLVAPQNDNRICSASDYVFKLFDDNRVFGTYCIKHNIIVINYDITHRYNDTTINIFEFIISTLEELHGFKVVPLNLKPKEESYLTIGGKVYTLKCINESGNLFNDYVERVNTNFRKALAQHKEQFIQKLNDEKKRYLKYRKEHVPMPDISYSDIVNQKVMISKSGTALTYNFFVSFKVTEAIDEIARKRVLLSEPILFSDHILSLIFDENNRLISARLADINGKGTSRHLHTSEGTVCTGSTQIIGQTAKCLADVVKLKDRLLAALTRYNVVDAVQRTDLRDTLRKQLEQAPAESWTQRVWNVR